MSEGTRLTVGLLLGLILGGVGAYYTGKALSKANASDGKIIFGGSAVFTIVCVVFITLFKTPEDRFSASGYHKLKEERDYYGAMMLEDTEKGNTGLAQDWARRYSEADERLNSYYRQWRQFEEATDNSNSVSTLTNR